MSYSDYLKAPFDKASDLKNHEMLHQRYKIGYERYRKVRKLSVEDFCELHNKNLKTGIHFDTLVDQL